jgi:ribosomal protein S18 acetylase RimI-like enzyme
MFTRYRREAELESFKPLNEKSEHCEYAIPIQQRSLSANWHKGKYRMETENISNLKIRKFQDAAEAETCARMMASTEPWITLCRDHAASLKIITDLLRKIYLAILSGKIVGFSILLMRGAFVGYIQSVCVAPEWRSKGIGSQLMSFLEQRILSETPNIFICVSSFNKGAQRLYERLGYEVIGELKDYIIPGHSEILLRKTVAPLTELRKK